MFNQTFKNVKMSTVAFALSLSLASQAAVFGAVLDDDGVMESALGELSADVSDWEALTDIKDEPVADLEGFTSEDTKDKKEETKSDDLLGGFTSGWDGPVLSAWAGTVMGPSGKETYYNLDMSGVVEIMRGMGNNDAYWVREDGCKMLGNYIMCAANLDVHPRGSLVECSLGTCIVCDTGGFAYENPYQLDIATTW